MHKQDSLREISTKLNALDNEVKLKILVYLIESGSKSITDISRELNINFSTTHKYLESLEKAGLVTSKQVADNRLKRLFFVNDFQIDLSPKGLSKIKERSKGKTFSFIDQTGKVAEFDSGQFAKKYFKRGLPMSIIYSALESVKGQAYDGVTLIELRRLFQDALRHHLFNIRLALKKLDKVEMHKRTYNHLMKLVHPEALTMHANGDIFIKNLREPKLLNYVADLRGLGVHTINEEAPQTLEDFLKQIKLLLEAANNFSDPNFTLPAFNYTIAQYTKDMSNSEISKILSSFFSELEKSEWNVYVSLDLGLSVYHKKFGPAYHVSDVNLKYSDFKNEANRLTEIISEQFNKKNYKNLKILYQIWNKTLLKHIKKTDNVYVANMKKADLTTYVGNSRFDFGWKKWEGTLRMGEAQRITINLPRLALKSDTEKEFLEQLKSVLDSTVEFLLNMSELNMAHFYRKYKISFKSLQKDRWEVVSVNNISYAIALCGLKQVIKFFNKKEKFGQEILKFANNFISSKPNASAIRVALKNGCEKYVAGRFHYLDYIKYRQTLEKYCYAIGEDISLGKEVYSQFKGGYSINFKGPINDFLKSGIEYAYISKE